VHKTGIEYGTYGWNPTIGCDNGPDICPVNQACWARGMAERGAGVYGTWPKGDRFAVRFLPERLDEPKKEKRPGRVLVGFMGDLMCPGRPRLDILRVLRSILDTPWHSFLCLTKNPGRYSEFPWPPNAWRGVTVTGAGDTDRIWALKDARILMGDRYSWLSYEPALGPITGIVKTCAMDEIDWLVIGAQDRPRRDPKREWVEEAIEAAQKHGVAVFIKDNLAGLCAEWGLPVLRDYPEGMVGHK